MHAPIPDKLYKSSLGEVRAGVAEEKGIDFPLYRGTLRERATGVDSSDSSYHLIAESSAVRDTYEAAHADACAMARRRGYTPKPTTVY